MKRSLLSLLVLASVAWQAQAQSLGPAGAPAAKPVVKGVPTPMGSEALPAVSATPLNPFTGRPAGMEEKSRQLENARMETQLMDEQRRQLELRLEIESLPLRKKAELEKSAPVAPLPATPLGASNKPANTEKEAKPKKNLRDVQVTVIQPESKPVVQAPRIPQVEVASIFKVGASAGAILNLDGDMLSVKDGDSTSAGVVRVIDETRVQVGGSTYQVHGKNIGRVYAPPVAENTVAGAAVGRPVAGPATAAVPGGLMQDRTMGASATPAFGNPAMASTSMPTGAGSRATTGQVGGAVVALPPLPGLPPVAR